MDGMPKTVEEITAAEADQNFPRLLRQVREDGRQFVVTEDGVPVARILPLTATDRDGLLADEAEAKRREAAKRALLDRVRAQPFVIVGPWTRDELYEDEPE